MGINKVLIPLIRKVVPNQIAQDIVNVQPMTSNTGGVFTILDDFYFRPQMYSVIDTKKVNGKTVFAIGANEEIIDWIKDTFVVEKDYNIYRTLKGVWVEISEEAFTLLKLKWA